MHEDSGPAAVRDLDQCRRAFERWLTAQQPAGENVVVSPASALSGGYSGDLLAFDATWTVRGERQQQNLVVRFEPATHNQVFLDTNFHEQYRVIKALGARTEVRVPRVIGYEADPSVLGSRFYVMARMPGTPGLIGGEWIDAVERHGRDSMWRMWWHGLEAMAVLHRVDAHAVELGFLDQPDRGDDPIAQQLHYYREYYAWVAHGQRHEVIEYALDWLEANNPRVRDIGVQWGDARRGNQLFSPDLRCTAILDLEMVTLGPAEADLGWWLYTSEIEMREPLGEHTPSAEETVRRYGQLLGRELSEIDYFVVFAAMRVAVLMIKLQELRGGHVDGHERAAGDAKLAQVLHALTNAPAT